MTKFDLKLEQINGHLHYNPDTGVFTWTRRRNQFIDAGHVAGSDNGNGYLQIHIGKFMYLAHHLAFLYMTGAWPEGEVDHKNGVRNDNSWNNLRPVTRTKNMQNQRRARADNETGMLGVRKLGGKFQARIDGKSLGVFVDPVAAHQAYVSAKRATHEGNTL